MSNSTTPLLLYQKLTIKKPIQRCVEVLILILALCLLLYRLLHLKSYGLPWLLAFFSELCFSFDWFLYILLNWNPVHYETYPQRLQQVPEVPPVDVLVTTADWKLEPPIMVVNTVLSWLAVDYRTGKLTCYVSDDGGSPILLYALVEASNFAKIWVPFCKKYNIQVRAPFRYFAGESPSVDGHEFRREEKRIKDEYERLCGRMESAEENPMVYESSEYYEAFRNTDNKNHPTIIKVLLESKGNDSNGIPNLVYVAREKRPNRPHYYKAGALNVLTRVSGVMTNAPFIVNIDCDMYVNNPNVVVEATCILLGAKEEESVFVQFPQMFYNELKDDPFACQLNTLFQTLLRGMAGIQGPLFGGCNCFHRRKTIYTLNCSQNKKGPRESSIGNFCTHIYPLPLPLNICVSPMRLINSCMVEMISITSSYAFGILSLVLKLFGISESVFEVTPKGESNVDVNQDDCNVGKFAFNESPLFIIGTAVVLLHLMALASKLVGMQPLSYNDGRRGSGIGEILGCVWVLFTLLPFLRGLFAKGKYGIPFPTICKSAALILLFVPFYKWL